MDLQELQQRRESLHNTLVRLIMGNKDWDSTEQQLRCIFCWLEIDQLEQFIKALEEKVEL